MHIKYLITVVRQYDTITLLILSIMEINVWLFCVCEELGNVLFRIPEGTGSTWKN